MRMRSMVGASNRDEVYTLVRAMTLQYIQRRLDFVVDDMRPLRTTSLQARRLLGLCGGGGGGERSGRRSWGAGLRRIVQEAF